ncbi:hypothetical protein [Haloprofundus salinisoli]|uniref:hypothetical protein n=1 Tax=Haloprofundus salinisoli TaxID=2876193 RepID=UPI001CCBC79D|nr:hypothetical protein [Haloprofundus salinisoli]
MAEEAHRPKRYGSTERSLSERIVLALKSSVLLNVGLLGVGLLLVAAILDTAFVEAILGSDYGVVAGMLGIFGLTALFASILAYALLWANAHLEERAAYRVEE